MKLCKSEKLLVFFTFLLFKDAICVRTKFPDSKELPFKRQRLEGVVGGSPHSGNESHSSVALKSLLEPRKPAQLIMPCGESSENEEVVSRLGKRKLTPHPRYPSSSSNKTVQVKKSSMPSGDSVDSTATTEKPKSHVTDEVRTWRRDFVAAIQADDLARIKLLASECDDVNFRIQSPVDPSQYTYPLQLALHHHLQAIAQYIIENMAFDPDALDSYGHTALSLSIELGNHIIFRQLLQVSNLDIPVRRGLGLTHLAASMDAFSALYLIDLQNAGLDFKTVCGIRGWTPLQYAVTANNLTLAKWLIDSTDCNLSYEKNKTIVLDALKAKNSSLALFLIGWGADWTCVDENNMNIFHVLAKSGLFPLIPNFPSNQDPLTFFQSRDTVKGYCPVHYAAEADNVFMMEYFGKHYHFSDKTEKGSSVLEVAVESASVNVIRYLMGHDLIDLEDSFRNTYPAFIVGAFSALKDHPRKSEVLSAILEFTPEGYKYLFDEKGLNIIHYAVISNDMALLKTLKEQYKYDLDYMDNGQQDPPANSPLSWAIFLRNFEMVKYFLENGSSPKERVRHCLFTPEDAPSAINPEDQGDVTDLKSLAELFGGPEITDLLKKYLLYAN